MLKNLTKEEKLIHTLEEDLFLFNEFRIQLIIDYLKEFEKYIKSRSSELEDKINAWQQSEKESHYSGLEYYIDDYRNFETNFKQLKIESTFLSSYALFEHHFKSKTKYYKDHFELKLKVDDLSGNNYISKSKRYIEKVVDIDLSSLNDDWNKIATYQKIRNKIVHHNGYLNENDQNLKNQISQLEGVLISRFNSIEFTDKVFILDFWKIINQYMEGIVHLTKSRLSNYP